MPRSFIPLAIVILLFLGHSDISAQDTGDYQKQLWGMAFLNWKLNERWVYNQDIGLMHTFASPAFDRLFLRSQINRQLTGAFSLHGGIVTIYSRIEDANDALLLQPWLGAKLRWPSFWRINFVHYARFEQQFRHTFNEDHWDSDFRVRYKLSTNVPINHESLIDRTLYAILAYEFFSVSLDEDVLLAAADIHRVDFGLGFKHNLRNRYEAVVVAFHGRDDTTQEFGLSSLVFFLRYKRFMNWQ